MDKLGDNLPELFYDLLGIFIPGFYSFFCFSLMYEEAAVAKIIEISFLNKTVSTIFLVYLLGHIVYTFGSFFIVRVFKRLSGSPIDAILGQPLQTWQKKFNNTFLREQIPEDNFFKINIEEGIRYLTNNYTFDLSNPNNIDYTFEFCRNYIMEKAPKRAAVIRKEQAYGEMSRGIIFVSLLCILWVIIKELFSTHLQNFWYILLFYTISLICFSYRYGQARFINPIFIFSSFCSIVSQKIKDNKKENEN